MVYLCKTLNPSFNGNLNLKIVLSPERKCLPRKIDTPLSIENVNSGYTTRDYTNNDSQIVIYRKEEATRVLVHEILHAACCDPQNAPLEWKEANTETWAELFLIAILSEGSEKEAQRLWAIQSQWIANQNAILRTKYGVQSPEDYAWRYTLGREHILETLKVELPEPNSLHSRSLRLTSPEIFS
jgi:hypothetical protein